MSKRRRASEWRWTNSHCARHGVEQARAVQSGLEGDAARVLEASHLVSDRLRLILCARARFSVRRLHLEQGAPTHRR